jgi:transcriptional regulator with XRE-family HTH domain
MARKLDDVMAALPARRRAGIERRARELASLKGLRQAARKTQVDLAQALGVGQDTVSRLEQRGDMLLSTLRRYVEAMGGELELVARFPNSPPMAIDHLPHGKSPARASARTQRSSHSASAAG